jgi:hypothetical protein
MRPTAVTRSHKLTHSAIGSYVSDTRRMFSPLCGDFHEIVNSDRYVNDTLNPFFNQLTAEERQYGYFQQNNTTAHTANAAMVAQFIYAM